MTQTGWEYLRPLDFEITPPHSVDSIIYLSGEYHIDRLY